MALHGRTQDDIMKGQRWLLNGGTFNIKADIDLLLFLPVVMYGLSDVSSQHTSSV
jgi:hypothetical protein